MLQLKGRKKLFKRKPGWLMSTVVPSSLRLIRELNSRTKIELPKMRVFLGCKTAKYKIVFCISEWNSVQTLSTMKEKDYWNMFSSPTLQLQAEAWASGILYESDRIVKLQSSDGLKKSDRWDVRRGILYSNVVVWSYRRTDSPTPVKCIANVALPSTAIFKL